MKVGNGTAPKVETVTEDDDDDLGTFVPDIPVEPLTEMPEQDIVDNNGKLIEGSDHIVDSYINMEVKLPEGEKELYGKVVGLCLDKEGRMIGTPNNNPYMNTVLYEIKFDDGTSKAYGANIIAENMWRSVNNEGYQEDSLHSVVDIRFKTNAVKDTFMYDQNGKRILKKTTRGVDLLVALKSGKNPDGTDRPSKSWIPLKELKESHPLEVAKFAVANRVNQMPAFKW